MSDFDQSIAGDARAMARFDAAADKLIADARQEGLTITRDDLKGLLEVKIAVFSNLPLDSVAAMREVKDGPAASQIRTKELARQLVEAQNNNELDLSSLPPAQRMTMGREMAQIQAKADKQPPMSAYDEVVAVNKLRRIESPALRMAMARELGIYK